MCAADTERSRASSAVRSPLARPRTPSVPKRRATRGWLSLAELGRLARLLETSLLALDDAGVTRQQTGLLQTGAVGLFVDRVEAAGHAEAQRAGLTGDATAVDAGDHVEATLELRGRERLVDDLLVQLVREVARELAAVDGPLAGAGDDAHPGHCLLATAGGRGLGGVSDALLVDREGLLAGGLGVVSHVGPLRVLGR